MPPLVLAAAVCLLVFERHPPKEKINNAKIAEEAGVDCSYMMECYVSELVPHHQASDPRHRVMMSHSLVIASRHHVISSRLILSTRLIFRYLI